MMKGAVIILRRYCEVEHSSRNSQRKRQYLVTIIFVPYEVGSDRDIYHFCFKVMVQVQDSLVVGTHPGLRVKSINRRKCGVNGGNGGAWQTPGVCATVDQWTKFLCSQSSERSSVRMRIPEGSIIQKRMTRIYMMSVFRKRVGLSCRVVLLESRATKAKKVTHIQGRVMPQMQATNDLNPCHDLLASAA
jgi:hypothetical protein